MQQQKRRRVIWFVRAGQLLVGVAAATLLFACGADDKPQATASAPPVKHDKAPVDPTATMAHAVTMGSSSVPVDLKYEILSKPLVGSPIEIELAVVPKVGADSMSVAYVASPGLTLSTDSAPAIEAVKAGKIERVKFSAVAHEATVFYVTVTATIYTAGSSSARNFAIPIIVSATAQAEAPAAAPHPAKKS